MKNNPILTVLIPTYNRFNYICSLLGLFKNSSIYQELAGDIEIVVADNGSVDSAGGKLGALCNEVLNCRLISYQEHLPTAEENVFRSFENCLGKYTWVLGDDDVPAFENLPRIISELKSDKHDFLIFNAPIIGGDGAITTLGALKMHEEQVVDDIVNITMHNGFWFVLAGMSSQILRTSFVKNYDFGAVLKESVIYSHVTAYLDCFHGKKTACFNHPLVWYKVTYRDVKHWQAAAKKMNVFDEYFWTLGFIKQLKFLTKKGIISKDALFYGLDQNDFFKFRPINVVHEKFFSQILLGISSKDKRQFLNEEEFYEIFDYLLNSSVYLRESLWEMEAIYKNFLKNKEIPSEKAKEKIYNKFKSINSNLLYGFFVRKYKDYLIYKISSSYYAVNSNNPEYLEEELKYVDPKIHSGILYIEKSIDGLIEMIEKDASLISSDACSGGYREQIIDNSIFYKKIIAEKDLLLQRYSCIAHEKEITIDDLLRYRHFGKRIRRMGFKIKKKIKKIMTRFNVDSNG